MEQWDGGRARRLRAVRQSIRDLGAGVNAHYASRLRMSLRRVACAAIAVLAVACSQARPPAQHAKLAAIPASPPRERVPDFEVYAVGGVRYSSKALVGKQPFIAVFFATWCDYCQGELKTIAVALERTGPMPVIPVSVDGPDTWDKVPAYLASFGIRAPAVRASHYKRFAATYNPADILPSVAIVGRDGALVDYLHGYDPAHADRLLASLRHAKAVPPLPSNELNAQAEPDDPEPDDPDDPVGPAEPEPPDGPSDPDAPDPLSRALTPAPAMNGWSRLANLTPRLGF
ncbi:MAG: hypothetical protein ABUL60_07990 [Myxococcales bacterium]